MNSELYRILTEDPDGILDLPPVVDYSTTSPERLLFNYHEVYEFYKTYNRLPQTGENLYESILATRLKVYADDLKIKEILKDEIKRDHLFSKIKAKMPNTESLSDISLNQVLKHDPHSLFDDDHGNDILHLRYVSDPKARNHRIPIGKRFPCKEFESFRHFFDDKYYKMHTGESHRLPIQHICKGHKREIVKKEKFFIIEGQMVYVIDVHKDMENRIRKRFIYEDATEAHYLFDETFMKKLYKKGYIITSSKHASDISDYHMQRKEGFIYIAKSLSNDDHIQKIPHLYKIGYTEKTVEERIRSAHKEPTYLMSKVDIVYSMRCCYIKTKKLESLVHEFFSYARVPIHIQDEFGKKQNIKEWFSVPLPMIKKALEYFLSMSISRYIYDHHTMTIQKK